MVNVRFIADDLFPDSLSYTIEGEEVCDPRNDLRCAGDGDCLNCKNFPCV